MCQTVWHVTETMTSVFSPPAGLSFFTYQEGAIKHDGKDCKGRASPRHVKGALYRAISFTKVMITHTGAQLLPII